MKGKPRSIVYSNCKKFCPIGVSDISSFLRKQESRSLFPRKRESIVLWIPVVTGKYWIPAYAAISAFQQDAELRRSLATAYQRLGMAQEAEQQLKRAQEIHPHDPEAGRNS